MEFKQLLHLLYMLLIGFSLNAQNGVIQGTVTDADGVMLPGANLTIASLKRGAVSNFDGKFVIVGIPAGNYELKATYLGYNDVVKKVDLSSTNVITVNIVLQNNSLILDEVRLAGIINGQVKALNQQKTNINITNIVSNDQVSKFPDANIGDALKRIPGITMQVDQGEARDIIIRGLSPQLNSVTLNGSRIPSAEGDNRNIQMDLIPSYMIKTIEVNKAVTPDMDADALGGSINLITRTAPQDFRTSVNIGSGITLINDQPIYDVSFLAGDRFGKNDQFGFMVAGSYNNVDYESDNVEAEWNTEFEADGEDLEVRPYAETFEIRQYLVQRIRRSASLNLDYQINPKNNLYIKSLFSWRDDKENRFVLEHAVEEGETDGSGQSNFEIDSDGFLTRFPVEVIRETKGGINNDRNENRRLEDQRLQNYTLGGDHILGSTKVGWLASYSKASEERLNERYAAFETVYEVNNVNPRNTKSPLFLPINSDDAALENFELGEITEENQYTEEEDINAFINIEIPVNLTNYGNGFVKFGARGRFKNKLRDNDFFELTDDFEDQFPTQATVPTINYSDPDFLVGSQYQIGSFTDPEFLGSLTFNTTADNLVFDEFLRANFEVKENVYAGYGMISQKLSEKFNLLAGLRIEHTEIEAVGNDILNEEELVGQIKESKSYTNILPGLHIKFDVTDKTIFRFAWTNTIARPNYEDITPTEDFIQDDNVLERGNPELEATTSINFDLSVEHYFKNIGLISGGIFYKVIEDFRFESRVTGDDNITVITPENGDDAEILGFEFAFQRQLDFLPGFAKNFSVYTNYTYLQSETTGIIVEGEERQNVDLPNTAPIMFNGSIGYDNKKFNARLSANFSDDYIDELGEDDFTDRFYDEQFFLDFSIGYAITKNLRVYSDLTNITNQPLRFYQGDDALTQQVEFYDRRLTLGLKYDFFK